MKLIHTALLALALPACVSSYDGATTSGDATSSGGTPGVCAPGAAESCYAGPASTLDVGACHAGVRTCAADGSGFGDCVGQVVPQAESCGSQVDVDCDGKTGCSGDPMWKLPITGTPQIGGVAASDDGEIVFFGWAQSIDIGLGAQGDGTTWGLFAAGVHADGTPAWLRTFPGVDASTRAGAIVMSPAHEATLAVYAEGTVTLGAVPFDASPDGVLAIRFEGDGSIEAANLVDLSGPSAILAPWVDVARIASDGSVLLGGAGFLATLGPAVTTTSHRRFAGDVTFADLGLAPDGSLFATGSYEGSFEAGGGATPVSGDHGGFVARLAGQSVSWSETLGGDTETRATSVIALPDGVLAVGGLQASGGSLIDDLDVASSGFLAQRDGDGMVASSFFGWGPASPQMTLDAAGDIVVRLVMDDVNAWHGVLKTTSTPGEIGKSPYWVQSFQWAPYTATIPTGETIVVTQAGVQKLDR